MILVTTQCFPPTPGGIEILMAGLAENIAATGEPVRVFADGVADPETDSRARASYQLTRYNGFKPLRRRMKAMAIASAARQPGVHGVFADSWKSLELLPVLPVPIVVLAHGTEFPLKPNASKRRRIQRALSKAHRIVASSAYTAELVRGYVPEAGGRIAVIHPPIPPQRQPSLAARAEVDGMRQGKGVLITTIARLEPRKGVDRVITAVAELRADHPDLVYAVGGGGADLDRLQALARDLGVADQVLFIGWVGEYQRSALLAGADLYVMPTHREGASVEGFGIVYLEAAWHGLAAIAGVDGGGGEAVQDRVTGFVVDGDDEESITAALRWMIEHPKERKVMGDAAAARVRRELMWSQAAGKYLAALG
jgi:phosphatidylinositol alpha-1,6-mannosyltransferase